MALRGKKPSQAKPSRPRIAVFGPPGIGKTWTALDFPACYYVDAEGGANLSHYTAKLETVGATYMGPEDGASDFSEVLKEILALRSTKHDRKTLVIDSYTKLFENEIQAEIERLHKANKEPAFGSEKKPAIAKSRQLVSRLDSLDMNVLIVLHEKAQWEKGEQIGHTFDGHDKLGYELNLVLRIVKQGKTRKAQVVKSRFEQFEEGTLVDWCYETFRDAFGVNVLEADSKPVEQATEAQLSELQGLLDFGALDATTQQKWLDKAGVERWSDMDTITLAKCIEAMKKKLPTAAA